MQKLFMALLLAGVAISSQAQDKNAVRYSRGITKKALKAKLTIIASAEMQGRETATEGQRKAAAYIEGQFKTMGLEPGNGNNYQQEYPIFIDTLSTLSFVINNTSMVFGKDYVTNISSVVDTSANLKEIILAGYGITDSIYDDYKDLDVKGKCVLITEGEPKLENGNYLLTGTDKHSRSYSLYAKVNNARNHGAAIILFYQPIQPKSTPPLKSGPYINKGSRYSQGITILTITPNVLETITQGLSTDLNDMINSGHSLSATLTTNVQLDLKKEATAMHSTNVIGVLPGTDKKDEFVFVTGHYDHLGTKNGKIYFGADDDGSGTCSVMQIAQAFMNAKAKGILPRRTMIFMTVSGEEKGLWGSEYYTEHPTVDLAKASADLNIDMVGRIAPDYTGNPKNYVYVIGDDKLSSDLTPLTDSIDNQYMHMELDRKFNDPKDPARIYYRSDHYNFAKKGVPILFYFNGIHADYHQPTDTVDKINFKLMTKRAKLVFFTAWAVANREAMLKRDIPLP